MMKPKAQTPHDTSLLDYLEDIIGTDKYVQPIEDAGKQYAVLARVTVLRVSAVPTSSCRSFDTWQAPRDRARPGLQQPCIVLRSPD